jgi:hypothetical protein
MAEQDRPNQNANKSKAEGERFPQQERGAARGADRDTNPERLYDGEDSDDAGGITNRPLSDEVENQESLPERGTTKDRTGDPGSRRHAGDYREDQP